MAGCKTNFLYTQGTSVNIKNSPIQDYTHLDDHVPLKTVHLVHVHICSFLPSLNSSNRDEHGMGEL